MVPSFKNTALIFLEISFIQFLRLSVAVVWHHHWSNLHNRETSISPKRKKIFQKENCYSSVFWKAFQISTKFFSVIYTLGFFCLSVPKRDLDTKKTPPSFEVCPESRPIYDNFLICTAVPQSDARTFEIWFLVIKELSKHLGNRKRFLCLRSQI